MEKPITLIRQEVINNIANTINDSGLPPFIIEPILQNFITEVRIAMQKQYEDDKLRYQQSSEKEE